MDDLPWHPAATAIGAAGKKKNRFGAHLLITSICALFYLEGLQNYLFP
jgi:hypothetical protein